jgi:hypothetical protein
LYTPFIARNSVDRARKQSFSSGAAKQAACRWMLHGCDEPRSPARSLVRVSPASVAPEQKTSESFRAQYLAGRSNCLKGFYTVSGSSYRARRASDPDRDVICEF